MSELVINVEIKLLGNLLHSVNILSLRINVVYLEEFFSNLNRKVHPHVILSCSLDVLFEDVEVEDAEPGGSVQEGVRTVVTPHRPHL